MRSREGKTTGSSISGLALRIRQIPALGQRLLTHPSWFVETVRLAVLRQHHARRRFSLVPYAALFIPARDIGPLLFGVPHGTWDAAMAAVTLRTTQPFGTRADALRLLGAAVATLEPTAVLEVGVAHGQSSAVILAGLDRLSLGTLYSLDLPMLHMAEHEVGDAVPPNLRRQWVLRLGPSRTDLPEFVHTVAPLDLAFHDGDHTYASQQEDLRVIWPYLRPGGVLIIDDVCNPAFVEFADEVHVRPYLVGRIDARSALGIIRKPA